MFGCKKADKAPAVEIPNPAKIVIRSDKDNAGGGGAVIQAYNNEEAVFKIIVTDQNGNELNIKPRVLLDGKDYTDKSFKTDVPGKYTLQASIGKMYSNEYVIRAVEITEKYISILPTPSIQSISPSVLVTISIPFKNISSKRLRFVSFDVQCLNAANEPIAETNSSKTNKTCVAKDRYDAGSSHVSNLEVGYFLGTKSIVVKVESATTDNFSVIYPAL